MQFVAAPILGQLSDMFGRKKLLTLCLAVVALAQFVFGIGISIVSVPLLFIARAVAGIAAGNLSIIQAAIADVTEPGDRAKSFGLIGAAIGIGLILGPFLSGWIASSSGSSLVPFWVAGSLGLANLVFVTRFLPETNLQPKNAESFSLLRGIEIIRAAAHDSHTRLVYMGYFLYVFGFAYLTSFFGIFLVSAMEFSVGAVGIAFAFAGICQIFAQLFLLRRLVPHHSERSILKYSMLLSSVCLGAFSFFPNKLALILFTALITIPHGLTLPNLTALVSKGMPAEKQGVALGISASLLALGNALAPLLAGTLSGYFGITAPFIAAGLLVFVAWAVLQI
jgi:DHA1 family tetracycline resistance protein-like MFS transporter